MNRLPLFLLIILLFSTETIGAASKFDNEVFGVPQITCEKDEIVVEVETKRPFNGRIFVKGDYANSKCVRNYSHGRHVEELVKSDEPNSDSQVASERRDSRLFQAGEPENVEDTGSRKEKDEGDFVDSVGQRWKGFGGVTTKGRGVFSGSREEPSKLEINTLRIFDKGSSKSDSQNGESSSSCSKTCEPCVCGDVRETRRRRQVNRIALQVPLNSCNSKRDRTLNPPSLVVSFVAVVSFHDSFITKLDKAYHIQCAYTETDKLVATELNVSMSPEVDVTGTVSPPSCNYMISGEDGAAVHNTLVGQLVRHRWDCADGFGMFRMLVHDCFVEDGTGQAYQVIDANGCTSDKHMLQTPIYNKDGLIATVDAYIFKFPDRTNVDFRCSITFCSVEDGECEEFSPPRCDGESISRRQKRSTRKMPSLSLHSNELTVLDVDVKSNEELPQRWTLLPAEDSSFCLSVGGFGVLVSASTFLSTISAIVVFAYVYMRHSENSSTC
ncbi:unnamed protein product [Caenorhabditis auriculariae]|uniref:ZP domain-containing protein n=1 Tax=Caenorhabditis auriculariae TaxID=2777116 RepID=A0A8S1HDY4_9PELO|nr:unnamed protein product [Caenorhabditis auriculariae]